MMTTDVKLATDKQVAFILKLTGERPTATAMWTNGRIAEGKPMTFADLERHDASTLIDWLLAQPKEMTPVKSGPVTVDIEDGMYQTIEDDGMTTVRRVYHTVHGANVQVAKRLIVHAQCVTEDEVIYTHEFEYEGKAGVVKAAAGTRLTADAAKALGMNYSFCVRCGTKLTRTESEHVGYGKTCAGHEGWWYPTAKELRELTASTESPVAS